MADTLPEGFILNRTNHPTARLQQAFREIEEEMRSLYAMATCHQRRSTCFSSGLEKFVVRGRSSLVTVQDMPF